MLIALILSVNSPLFLLLLFLILYTLGPGYVYLKETKEQKSCYSAIIKAHNLEVLPQIQQDWRVWQAADRLKWQGRKKPGVKAQFSNFRKRHPLQMARGAKRSGVDFMRYCEEVLKPILIPWLQDLNKERGPGNSIIFQQDNAPSHTSKWTLQLLADSGIEVLEHPANSPDMNAIEGVWEPMRISITHALGREFTLEWTVDT